MFERVVQMPPLLPVLLSVTVGGTCVCPQHQPGKKAAPWELARFEADQTPFALLMALQVSGLTVHPIGCLAQEVFFVALGPGALPHLMEPH